MNTATTDRLRQHLQALPEPELPDTLWGRLDDARQRRLHRRRVGAGVGGAIAVALIVLAVVPLPNGYDASSSSAPIVASQPASLPSVQIVDSSKIQTASDEMLVTDKLANNMTANKPPIVKQQSDDLHIARSQSGNRQLDARLRSLDRNLQAAYRRGSSEAEIAQLWRTRQMLLADKTGHAVASRPIRI